MTASRSQILCAGRLYADLVFTGVPTLPALGTEVFSTGLALSAGGGAVITAATCVALGTPAALCATLPAAPFDALVIEDLRRCGVDFNLCQAAMPGDAPQITVAMSHAGDRAFLSHKAGAAMPKVTLPDCLRHLHFGELRSLTEHPDLLAQARAAGLTVSLDCGWDDELWLRSEGVSDLIAQVDVFLPNASEYAQLQRLGITEGLAPLTVVKDGASGARAFGPDGWVSVSALPATVVDPTGAGDAFNAGFVTEWLRGSALRTCLEVGNRCGANAVQHAGGTGGLRHAHAISAGT